MSKVRTVPVGDAIISGLTDLRDVLRRGEHLGSHFKITTRSNS